MNEDRQLVELELGHRQAGRRSQPQPDDSPHAGHAGQLDAGGVAAGVFGLGQLQRPERHIVGGAVFARGCLPLAQHAMQAGPPRHDIAVGQRAFFQVGLHPHHRHRRRRRDIVRINHLEQVLREPRKLRIQPQLHPGRQEREPFQQPLDVRVRALDAVERQAARDFRKLRRELAPHLAEVRQLALVVLKKTRIHRGSLSHLAEKRHTLRIGRSPLRQIPRSNRRRFFPCAIDTFAQLAPIPCRHLPYSEPNRPIGFAGAAVLTRGTRGFITSQLRDFRPFICPTGLDCESPGPPWNPSAASPACASRYTRRSRRLFYAHIFHLKSLPTSDLQPKSRHALYASYAHPNCFGPGPH